MPLVLEMCATLLESGLPVRAVLRIIGDDGVAGVTNRRIAQEAGVSLGSVTYHFATQQDLLRESLRHFVTEETTRFGDLAARNAAACTDLAQVVDVVGQVAEATGTDSERIAPYELYLHAGRDPELRAAAAECFAAYDKLAATVLASIGVKDADPREEMLPALVHHLTHDFRPGTARQTAPGMPVPFDAVARMARGFASLNNANRYCAAFSSPRIPGYG